MNGIFTIESDKLFGDIVSDTHSLLTIDCGNGTELRLDFSGDKLELKGDADMDEAAKIFFEECLKPHVDAYMATNPSRRVT